MEPKTIVIAKEKTLLREGIRKIIDLEPDLKVVATAESGPELLEAAERLRPAAVIVDTGLADDLFNEITFQIKKQLPETKVLLFAADLDENELVLSIAAGVNGVLLQAMEWDELLGQVRAALRGDLFLPASLALKLSNKLHRMITGEKYGAPHVQSLLERFRLTEKEYEISLLIAKGLNNRQIAEKLMYSDGTVRNYVSSVYEKIGVRDRAKAVIFLRDSGFQSQAELNRLR